MGAVPRVPQERANGVGDFRREHMLPRACVHGNSFGLHFQDLLEQHLRETVAAHKFASGFRSAFCQPYLAVNPFQQPCSQEFIDDRYRMGMRKEQFAKRFVALLMG